MLAELSVVLIFGSLAGALKWKRKLPRLRLVAALFAGVALASTALGGRFTGMVSGAGAVFLVIGLIVALVVTAVDLRVDRKADWPAIVAAVLVPVMWTSIGGTFGELGDTVVTAINREASQAVTDLFGV